MPAREIGPSWFAVGPAKLVVMSIATLGLYQVYWFYQQWRRVRDGGEDVWPLPRSLFGVIFGYPLFRRVVRSAEPVATPVVGPGLLAAAYVLLCLCAQLPLPFALITVLSVLPLAVVQRVASAAAQRDFPGSDSNRRLTPANWVGVVLGGALLATVILGALVRAKPPSREFLAKVAAEVNRLPREPKDGVVDDLPRPAAASPSASYTATPRVRRSRPSRSSLATAVSEDPSSTDPVAPAPPPAAPRAAIGAPKRPCENGRAPVRVLRYLAACLVSGIILGWAYGAFARGSFHYPPRRDAVAWWRQGLLDALDVVEWPGLFALALAVSLGLWAWSRRRAWAALPPRGRSAAVLAGVLALAGALIAMSNADSFGLPLAGVAGGLMGALAAALLVALWREASAARGTVLARWVAQLPVAGGQLAVTSAASLSLGYRGESALVHGIALLIGIALFVSQLAAAIVVAGLARRAAADR